MKLFASSILSSEMSKPPLSSGLQPEIGLRQRSVPHPCFLVRSLGGRPPRPPPGLFSLAHSGGHGSPPSAAIFNPQALARRRDIDTYFSWQQGTLRDMDVFLRGSNITFFFFFETARFYIFWICCALYTVSVFFCRRALR